MNEIEQNSLFADLDKERIRHPLTQPEDMLKFLFQGILGPGHLMADRETVIRRIETENARRTRNGCTRRWESGICACPFRPRPGRALVHPELPQ